ncbi:hypothetical protein BFP78_01930 [Gaetbulibacter sp. 5U11]|nr:hypothetical protein BFP78_01930 [Gaetbulibacter sp. 5U11]
MIIKVEWSKHAEKDIKHIFERTIKKIKSKQLALNVVNDIYETCLNINFVTQYQADEYLGLPYRRMIVRHFKIIYTSVNDTEIKILHIFDTYQNPKKLTAILKTK